MVLNMLNYFGKIFAGGFFRTLGKIFAFLIVGFFIAWLTGFINIGIVKAAGEVTSFTYNTIFGTNIDSYVQFKDLKTGAVYGSDVKRYGTGGGENAIGYWWGYHSLPNNYSTSAEGIAISTCSNSFIENNYYSILSYYIVTDNNFYVHNLYAKDSNIGLGYSWDYSLDHRNISPASYFASVSNTYVTGNLNLTFNTITFKANLNSNCVSWTVNKPNGGLNSSNFQYVGSRILYQGTEPPSNSEVTSLITQESNKINQNIDSMKEKQDETNQKLDEVNNTMKDDNVDTGQAGGFFDSFDNKDHGGISGVITAPLSAINKINQPCSAININLWDKDITLPCGDTLFWNKENVSTFRGVWNLLVGGPIIYLLMVKLFQVIQNLKNPDDGRVEVAKL